MLQRILHAEPAVFISLITALVTFGVSIGLVTQAHADQVVSLAAAIIPTLLVILNGLLTRQSVFSPKTVDRLLAANTPPPAGPPPSGKPAA